MLTTGFKLFFAYCIGAIAAAVLLGYTTGGNHLGPLTLGYKGGVGYHFGYTVLMTVGFASGVVAVLLQAFRDGDAEAEVALAGTETVPVGQPPLHDSLWPIGTALAVGVSLVGLVVHPAVLGVGLVILVAMILEWTMSAWADRATGDAEANRELRDRVMRPFEVPVVAFASVGIVVLAVSRIFLTSSRTGAAIVAIIVSALVFGTAAVIATRPRINKNVATGLVLLGVVAVSVGGIVAAVDGERDFEVHGEESHEGEATGEGASEEGATTGGGADDE